MRIGTASGKRVHSLASSISSEELCEASSKIPAATMDEETVQRIANAAALAAINQVNPTLLKIQADVSTLVTSQERTDARLDALEQRNGNSHSR